jgi:hypothetical protein
MLVTLLIYMGRTEHGSKELVEKLEDSNTLTMEITSLPLQQPMISSSFLTQIILSCVSETTRHLVAPIAVG